MFNALRHRLHLESRPPVAQLEAIYSNNDPAEKARQARACLDRYLGAGETRALRRAQRLCEAVTETPRGSLCAFIVDEQLVPLMRERSPRFVSAERYAAGSVGSEAFMAATVAGAAVGTLAARSPGQYDSAALRGEAYRLLRATRYSEKVAFALASHVSTGVLDAGVAHQRTPSARHMFAAQEQRTRRVEQLKAEIRRGKRTFPAPSAEEVEIGRHCAEFDKLSTRAATTVALGVTGINKDVLYAAYSEGMSLDDVEAATAWLHTAAGSALVKALEHVPFARFLESMSQPVAKMALRDVAERMKGEHDDKLDPLVRLLEGMN